MRKRYKISNEQVTEIEKAREKNRCKKAEKRLRALVLYSEGLANEEIGGIVELSGTYISEIVAKYCNKGLEAVIGGKYGGNHRNMSFEEEQAFLAEYKERAEKGQIVEVSEIKKAYEEKVGHTIGGEQIYRVLRRHGWRKVMPRSKHPNKASDEAIAASKKLKLS